MVQAYNEAIKIQGSGGGGGGGGVALNYQTVAMDPFK